METKKDEFTKRLKLTGGREIGTYKNEHGEVFMAYTIGNIDAVFVTGDELDWETSWTWFGEMSLIKHFRLSDKEFAGMKKVIDGKKKSVEEKLTDLPF